MDNKLFPIVGLVVAAVVFGPAGLNKSRPSMSAGGAAAPSTQGASNAPPASKSDKGKKEPEAVKLVPRSQLGPWVASCRFFGGAPRSPGVNLDMLQPAKAQVDYFSSAESGVPRGQNNSKTQKGHTQNRWCINATTRIQFVIATLPDPVNSHLALDFDRRIEAIQSAAQDGGYFNNQFWVPWDTSPLTGDSLEEKNDELMLRQTREAQPGIQIFGGQNKALFVFFVAETPTLGINKAQLTAAIKYIQEVPPASQEIPLLGPASSGSVGSLLEVLTQFNLHFTIITASATDYGALDQLRKTPNISFQQVLHEDQTALSRFLEYANDSLHIGGNEIAILSESGTQYGAGADDKALLSKLHTFRFPRQISVLRNAYPDQQTSSVGDKVPVPGLALDLKQTLGQTDDIPVMSMGELPSSQEAVLLEIAAQIRREKIKLAGIVATDIFDTLFLARFLKEFCPDVRLFLLDSDLLLIRAAEDYPLEGTLVVTNYPLITGSNIWFNASSNHCRNDLHFSNRNAEATYNAFSRLIGSFECMKDYALSNQGEPPLWLGVVGRNGYWPITLLRPQEKANNKFVSSGIKASFIPERPSNGYLVLCAVLIAVSILEFLCFFYAQVPGVISLRWLLQYFYLGDSPRSRGKAFFIISSSLVLATMDYVVFLPIWAGFANDSRVEIWYSGLGLSAAILLLALFSNYLLRRVQEWWRNTFYLASISLIIMVISFVFGRSVVVSDSNWSPYPWYSGICILTVMVTALCIGRALYLHYHWAPRRQNEEGQWVWFSWGIFLAFFIAWSCLVFSRNDAAGFFRYRSFDISGGTSPVLPYLFLLVGLYIWCWVHVRRIQFWQAQRAVVPAGDLDHQYCCGFRNLVAQISLASGKTRFHSASLTIFLSVFVMGMVLLPRNYIAGIEVSSTKFPINFDWLYICTLTLLYAFIFVSLFRFIYIWSALQQLLRRLERQPLRHAFDRLPKKYYSWTPLWYSGAARRTYAVLARSLECLRKLDKDRPAQLLQLPTYVNNVDETLRKLFCAESRGSIDLANESKQCKEAVRAASSYVLREFLIPHWLLVGDSEVTSEYASDDKEKSPIQRGDSKQMADSMQVYLLPGQKPPTLPNQTELIQVAEELVALRFIALIRYVGLQLRNQLTFISGAFIISIISLRSYPFLAHRTIGWSLTIIFLILGTGIVMVFSQMSKDAILSRITDTHPGKLDKEFYFRIASVGALPLLTVLASQFPEIGRMLFSWLQPAVEALH
jgi:hypothetical protein